MKNIFLFTIINLAGILQLQAQRTSSLLWEITGNGLTSPSYLYGTIHMMDEKDFIVRKEIDSVFALTHQAAFEIKLNDTSNMPIMQEWMQLPEGKTINDYCDAEEYKRIDDYLIANFGTPLEALKDQKPFIIAQLQLLTNVVGNSVSYDMYFFEKATNAGKEIKGLEGIEDQLHVFDSISYEDQIDWLIQSIDTAGQNDSLWNGLIDAYKKEDLAVLWQMLYETSPELRKYEPLMISNRNKRWVPVIEKFISSESTFIAVGAGHLPGDNGLLNLLTKKGYHLKAL